MAADAASSDAGGDDAAELDARPIDAAEPDAGPRDAAPRDYQAVASETIHRLHEMPDGDDLWIHLGYAFVTYTTGSTGTRPSGFFVQAEGNGPAIFVAIPWTSPPEGTVGAGDEIFITVTGLETVAGMTRITSITNLAWISRDNEVSAMAQDVSEAPDLVSALDNYESERIVTDFTITDELEPVPGELYEATVDTAAITGNADLRFRTTDYLRSSNDLGPGCNVSIDGVVWRSDGVAQLSVYERDFMTVESCPAPAVTGAVADSAMSIIVNLTRSVEGITDPPTQFTVTDDSGDTLAVDAALTFERGIMVVLAEPQVPGVEHTITIAESITDVLGTPMDPSMNSTSFTGFE